MLDARYSMLDARYLILDARHSCGGRNLNYHSPITNSLRGGENHQGCFVFYNSEVAEEAFRGTGASVSVDSLRLCVQADSFEPG